MSYVAAKYPEVMTIQNCGVIHRIDKVVSGLCVIARNNKSLIAIQSKMYQRAVHRCYHCLCVVAPVGGRWESPQSVPQHVRIETNHDATSSVSSRKVTVEDTPSDIFSNNTSVTRFEVIERFPHAHMVYGKCYLASGKKHQIRAQMAHVGLPILGDTMYGDCMVSTPVRPSHHRGIFLHASELCLPCPFEWIEIGLGLPRWFEEYLHLLRCEQNPPHGLKKC
eukprot:PhF_6_TR10445/c0_g1_i8/m.16544/K06180/rluD; 23S rRNA pseudouridine1911/1915/1917 synthase